MLKKFELIYIDCVMCLETLDGQQKNVFNLFNYKGGKYTPESVDVCSHIK